MTTLPQYSQTGITDMEALSKRARVCFILFGLSLGIAVFSFVGALILAFLKNYSPAFVLTAVSIIGFYSAPIYYNNAALSRASVKITEAIDAGAKSFEEISEKTGIRIDTCKKLYTKATAAGFIDISIN